MLSETVAGYGLHTGDQPRQRPHLPGDRPPSGLPYYQGYGMTIWERRPLRQLRRRAGLHAVPARPRLARHDQGAGEQVADREGQRRGGHRRALGRSGSPASPPRPCSPTRTPPPTAGGVVTSAGNLLADPLFNYLGDGVAPDYVPWHHYTGSCSRPRPRRATPTWPSRRSSPAPPPRCARTAGRPSPPARAPGGAATITVQSAASVRPHVVVVKYTRQAAQTTPRRPAPRAPPDPGDADRRDRSSRSRRRDSRVERRLAHRRLDHRGLDGRSAGGARSSRRWRAS